jgi:lactoylglutathione lyase
MRIDHIAVWTGHLERMKEFYVEFFGGQPGNKYVNSRTGFESYFITFDCGARLEIMHRLSIPQDGSSKQPTGYSHMAFSVGDRVQVDKLTALLRDKGHRVVGEPRQTGDGYYESCVLDPDGNRVEITA